MVKKFVVSSTAMCEYVHVSMLEWEQLGKIPVRICEAEVGLHLVVVALGAMVVVLVEVE